MVKVNQGHIVCLLYADGPYLGESVMGGSTVNTRRFALYQVILHVHKSIYLPKFLPHTYLVIQYLNCLCGTKLSILMSIKYFGISGVRLLAISKCIHSKIHVLSLECY